ncbi:HAD family phosphatase [Nocardiopsis sp. FIRDI 009]|uniref:HAD family hydrolase n=1 Tax=Nocardiopsis sp. FIRDI 009 TaxID=714197 RepID=UPI000E24E283|nr:HAD family phosphatase [Nocardiopsis sp. FIRDI 009]
MTGERLVDAVVFDYGGVLTGPVRDTIAAWMESDGIDPESFTRTLRAWLSRGAPDGTPIHRLETGELSVEEFDALLAAELGTVDGRPVDPNGLLGRLFAGMRPDQAMYALAEELRDLGVRVALLSNSWGNAYPRERIDALLDPVVISGEVGLRKPQAPIYELTLDRLGLPAERVVFVDDAEPNVLGARAVGMRAVPHTDAGSTRAALAELVPDLPGRSPAG